MVVEREKGMERKRKKKEKEEKRKVIRQAKY